MRSHTHIHTHIHISKLGQALTIANTTENFYSWASITDTELYSGKALILKSLNFFPKQDNNHWSLFMTCCVTVGAEELHKYLLSQVSLQSAGNLYGSGATAVLPLLLPPFLTACPGPHVPVTCLAQRSLPGATRSHCCPVLCPSCTPPSQRCRLQI